MRMFVALFCYDPHALLSPCNTVLSMIVVGAFFASHFLLLPPNTLFNHHHHCYYLSSYLQGDAGASAEPTEGTWQCGVCTFENDVATPECDVCGSAKPANAKITVPGADAEAARKEKEAAAKAQKVRI